MTVLTALVLSGSQVVEIPVDTHSRANLLGNHLSEPFCNAYVEMERVPIILIVERNVGVNHEIDYMCITMARDNQCDAPLVLTPPCLGRSRELVNLYNGECENEKDCSF